MSPIRPASAKPAQSTGFAARTRGDSSGATSAIPGGEYFDEAWYTTFYADVGAAVERGDLTSGLDHYLTFGRREGRRPSANSDETDALDERWYAAAYPLARSEVEAGRAADYPSHYRAMGRARGYLPNPFARRPVNPGAPSSRFGGLWPDRGNALDLVEGKREIGVVTDAEADRLKGWIRNGYTVISGALSPDILDRAEDELYRAYSGAFPNLLFDCKVVAPVNARWTDRIPQNLARALDLHWLSPVIRELIFAPEICRFLELIFERRCLATQTLAFLRGSGQAHHLDTFYVPYSSPIEFAASWIALEDVESGAGELSYYRGSHKLPEQLFSNEFRSLHELVRVSSSNDATAQAAAYEAELPRLAGRLNMPEETFLARRGDVLIWHAGLAHGGRPITSARTRKSIVTHYCPREVAPLYWEQRSALFHAFEERAYYSTVYYEEDQHQ